MDKNFINIDDLVRQRLGGGEEAERSGSWLQMKDLLDKEMPQKKAGFFYWRRMFSAVAVLAVIATAGISSYYLTSSKNIAAADGQTGTASISTPGGVRASVKTTVTGNEITTHISNMSTPADNNTEAGNTPNATAPLLASNDTDPAHSSATRTSFAAAPHQQHKTAQNAAGSKQLLLKLLAENGIDINKPVQAGAGSKQLLAANEKGIGRNTVVNHRVLATNINATTGNNNTTGTNTYNTSSRDAVVANSLITDNTVTGHNNHKNKSTAGHNAPAGTAKDQSAAPANNGATNGKAIVSGTVGNSRHRNRLKPIAANTANNADNTATSDAAVKATATTAANTTASSSANNNPSTATEPGKALAANTARSNTLPKGATAQIGDAAQKEVATANLRKSKRVIEKMVLFEHYIKTTPNEGYYKMDTISVERITREFGGSEGNGTNTDAAYASNNQPEAAQEPGSNENAIAGNRKAGTNNTTANNNKVGKNAFAANSGRNAQRRNPSKGANTTGSVASNTGMSNTKGRTGMTTEEDNAIEAESNTPSLAAASTTASLKAGLVKKETNAAKKGSGTKTVEKLSETFNDIKYKVTGVRFSPGITAGVNGTFFGPNDFKGFHFGVTGAFVFDDNWSVLAELKYFHRINSNLSIDDNYYTYTPAGPGQYSKQLVSQSYGFSSLQSIEMPLSLHYSKGNFSFFAGGNVVYSFSINTGAATMPNNTAAVLVSTPGADNKPSLSSSDFNSRIGLGYLLGLSYEVSPNVTLDFRSVQTVWNSMSSSGAQKISSQLYNSPSFQVSFGYRFGGKKDKE